MVFHVTLTEDEGMVGECPALPACIFQGKGEREALSNIKVAIAAWLGAEDQKGVSQSLPSGQPKIMISG